LLYTSQNLLGTIFRVTFTVFYRRIWNIVGKYSILCCDNLAFSSIFKGVTPFKKSDVFLDYRGSSLLVKRVIYR
jgi:hypothetical protein